MNGEAPVAIVAGERPHEAVERARGPPRLQRALGKSRGEASAECISVMEQNEMKMAQVYKDDM